ncbi:EI24 domain-containing protein [Arenibacterium sp. CAU 1754]
MGAPVIFRAFLLAIGQIGDRKFRKVLFIGILLTIVLLVAAYAAFLWIIGTFVGETSTLPLIGEVRWLDDLLGWSSLLLMLVLSVFLMIPVASAITSMFLEEVAQAVEDRHYPNLPKALHVPISEAIRDSINFLGVLVAANAVAFVLMLIFSPAAPFIFYGLNGFLLGREYFTLAAMRRIGREGAKELRARHTATIWAAGVLMAIPLSIPLMNLVIPVLGAATFTHIFHSLNASAR